ncbi:MAG: GAF domain-containing protein [Ignavibacteria bacterium]|nr:GAF domain-containing protein [Ignavibacteria bacterium]
MLNQQQKRIIIFASFMLIIAVFFFAEALFLKVLSAVIVVIYVGFLIFLRNDQPAAPFPPPVPEPKIDEETEQDFVEPNGEIGFEEEESSFKVVGKKPSLTPDFQITGKYEPILEMPYDLKEQYAAIANEDIPQEIGKDGQFSFFLEKLLTILKESYHAHSAIYFWHLKKKGKISIEKYVTNSNDLKNKRFDIQDDMLSEIVEKGEPKLLNGILASVEGDLIRYYEHAQAIKSAVGVPVFFNNNVIGILLIDSKETDIYGIETIFSMGRFVRLITMMIQLFEERYVENISQKRLEGLIEFITPLSSIRNDMEVLDVVEQNIADLFHWDAFALVLFQPEQQKFVTAKVINKKNLKFIGENLEIELKGTVVGKCIISGKPIKYDNTADLPVKRFNQIEDIGFIGSLLAVPLVFNKQNYGVLYFENLKENAYSADDLRFLMSITSVLSYIMYSYTTNTLLRSLAAYDMETRVLNPKFFNQLLETEYNRVTLLQIPASLAMVKIDNLVQQESLFEESPVHKIVKAVADLLKDEIPSTGMLGRIDDLTFAIYFFNMTPQDVFIWGEKMRVKIARLNLQVIAKQSTFTASIGIASLLGRKSVQDVLADAELALNKAMQNGGNRTTNVN